MMKFYQALLPLMAATTLLAGCEYGKSNAQRIIGEAEASVDKVRPDATINAPEELKPVEATLAEMKQNLDQGEYKAVDNQLPQLNEQYNILVQTLTAKQAENEAAILEWGELNQEVPKSVEAVEARVNSLTPNALPKGVTKDELETAKQDLETAKATWTEATQAAQAGHPAEARDKARIVQAKMEELKNSLGMNEQVAGNTPASAG
jgi:chromosome segregation ATPase